MIVESLVR